LEELVKKNNTRNLSWGAGEKEHHTDYLMMGWVFSLK